MDLILKLLSRKRLYSQTTRGYSLYGSSLRSKSGKFLDSQKSILELRGTWIMERLLLFKRLPVSGPVHIAKNSEEALRIKVGYADAAFYRCSGCGAPECFRTEPNCEGCGGEAELLRVISFVDCPGHESLMANMLSGAAVMDGSILVIAANEKVPQPQTREHLLALQMMGMKNIVVVQNKVDLITDAEAAENYKAIKNFVSGSVAADAPVIPISAQHKLNIDALIEAVEKYIPTPDRNRSAPPLMQVLRSFDVNHPGVDESRLVGGVLGGTLLQGTLSEGDEIELKPGIIEEGKVEADPIVTRVTSVMSSAGHQTDVSPGGLIAVGTGV